MNLAENQSPHSDAGRTVRSDFGTKYPYDAGPPRDSDDINHYWVDLGDEQVSLGSHGSRSSRPDLSEGKR